MSIAVMSRLFKAQIGSPSRKILAIRLGDFADDEGRGIWPTVGRLANETELSERTVQRLLKEFVDEGLLIVVAEGGGRPGQATRYDFDMMKLEALVRGKTVSDGCHHVTGDTTTPVTLDAETGDTDDIDGCHHVTQTVIEPLNKPLLERGRASELENREIRRANERAFKKAYQQWPTFVTDSEPKAFKAWMRLSDDDRQQASQELGRYLEASKVSGRSKFCTFAVYLSEKRWEKLPAKAEVVANTLDRAAPFGKMWAARVYEQLIAGSTHIGRLTALEQRMVDDGTFTAERLLSEKQVKFGFPVVNELFENASVRRGALVPAYLQPVAERMVAVKVGGDLWQAWFDAHAARGWPWLPNTGTMEYVYLPEGGPDALNELQALLRGIEK
ncbi:MULTISPECIES: helix-turn-helix domain-containing protein, partial [unclassified Pseudochrobactrum]|uniref:helix-turn-helix domain-containing protein n=1 Tax=unclassified Pseudochrobactrum TaxID=2647013 RepID=UPI00039C00FE